MIGINEKKPLPGFIAKLPEAPDPGFKNTIEFQLKFRLKKRKFGRK
jgi:hypothetical protein